MNDQLEHGHHSHGAVGELTRNQSLVLDALSQADGPLSAYSILDQLRDDGFRAPLQVYRALEKLVSLGFVHRLESLNAFVACSHEACTSHSHAGQTVFMICNDCGGVREAADADLAAMIAVLAARTGFGLTGATVELRGQCEKCATA